MALFMRSGSHWSGPLSLFWKLLPLVPLPQPMCSIDRPSTCSEIKTSSFRAHTPFSTLPEHKSSREEAQGEIERTLHLLSKGQSTKDKKINAWLYYMRDSTLEKIRAGRIPLQYRNCVMGKSSRKGIALAPHKVNHRTKYRALTFEGRIVYCRTASQVYKATMELLKKIKARGSAGQVPIGFGLEWRRSFEKGASPAKTAVVQICMEATRCYVMHVIHSGIPLILKSFLEGSSSVKVGIGIARHKLRNDYGVRMQSLMDLSDLGSAKLVGTQKIWSLSSLIETVMCRRLYKRKKIGPGNWDRLNLSKKEVRYAATIAFASWHLYKVLKGMPDLERKKGELLTTEKEEETKKERTGEGLVVL